MPTSIRPGDVLAGRYHLEDLLSESQGGLFWRAHDRVLDRPVAVHVIEADDSRANALQAAARASANVLDRCILRVLDAHQDNALCYVVNEWGDGISLDIMLAGDGPLDPRRAAWLASEVGASLAIAHAAGVTHGRLVPENVLLDHNGHVRLIGLAVDAALHGLPPGRRSADVVDLVAVLYAGLTGRWAGVSQSVVERAPVDTGQVLRPRQVRAGIPRVLDELCAEVLNGVPGAGPRTGFDLSTARGITDQLREFVGDPQGLAPATGGAVRALGKGARPTSYAAPEPAVRLDSPAGDEPVAQTETQPETQPAAQPVAQATAAPGLEQPTEAGMPIFGDDDDVTWLTARASKPPPPPPFDEAPERPLFAPDPPPGAPRRTPRPGTVASQQQGIWDPGTGSLTGTGTGAGSGTGTGTGAGSGTGTGSGSLVLEEEEEAAGVPGRRWLRLAAALAAAILLALAALVAVNLGRGRAPLDLGTGSSSSPSPSPAGSAAEPTRVAGLRASDLDPQGTPAEENPELAPAAVDGDPATAWRTQTYRQNLGPAGLKTGVGLVVDLGESRAVREVTVSFGGAPTGVSVFLTEQRPRGVRGLSPAGTEVAQQQVTMTFERGLDGRYVTVWLTSLPAADGGFRGEITEVEVRA